MLKFKMDYSQPKFQVTVLPWLGFGAAKLKRRFAVFKKSKE